MEEKRKFHLETIDDVISHINTVITNDNNTHWDKDVEDRDYNHRHLDMLKFNLTKLQSFVIHHTTGFGKS